METIKQLIQENPYNPLLGLIVGIEKCAKCGMYYIKESRCRHQDLEEKALRDRLEQTEKLLDMVKKREISIDELRGVIKFLGGK